MLGGIMKHHLMARLTQKGSTAGHGGQDTTLAFDPQILITATALSDEAYQCLGLMDVEIVTDKMPAGGLGSSGNDRLHMRQEIFLRSRGACVGSHHLPGHHIATDNEGAGAVANVLKLASLHFSGSQRQSWVLALQSLNPGQFIGAHRPFSLFGQIGSLPIDLTDRPNGFLFVRISRWGQPVTDQMRLKIPFFKMRAAWRAEIWGTMPRRMTSSAISRPVQWLIGRSFGCSQAIATIWQVCSAVISAGRPGRGISSNRSLIESSLSGMGCKPIQCPRQVRAVSTLTRSSLAISAFLFPSLALFPPILPQAYFGINVLVALMKSYEPNPNHFFLNLAEKIFYTYCILKADADIFLTIVDSLFKEDASLISLQQTFQDKFLKRLDVKILTVQDERVRLQLRDRLREVKEWGKPERYAEHLVPPRLNWLLDLGFLEPIPFRQHCFKSTGAGQLFLSSLLCIGEPCFHDVSDQWLDLEYWQIIAQTLVEIGSPVNWMGVDLETQYNLMGILLAEAFHLFRYSFVPRISLIQIMLYLSIRLLLDHHIVASPAALTEWFSSARVMDERRYEVRLSPRENESYLIIL